MREKSKASRVRACIMILTYNRFQTTVQSLDSLLASNLENDQVYVLDNGSEDGTPQYLTYLLGTEGRLSASFSDENLGVLAGREKLYHTVMADYAGKRVKPSYMVFLDSDVIVYDKDWLNIAINYLERNPRVWMVGAAGSMMAGDWSTFTPAYANPVDSVAGFCQVWRREKLEEIEFDHTFERFWAEDSDMCFQVISKGGEVHAYNLGLIHSPSHSGFGSSTELHKKNMARLKEKWQGKGVIKAEK